MTLKERSIPVPAAPVRAVTPGISCDLQRLCSLAFWPCHKSKENPLSHQHLFGIFQPLALCRITGSICLQRWSLRQCDIELRLRFYFFFKAQGDLYGWHVIKENSTQVVMPCVLFLFFILHSLISTLKNKELSPVIGQKGIQGTPPPSGHSQHSEHSPHTLRRGNKRLLVLAIYLPAILLSASLFC